jgi:NADPH:quinone reductase-like Zn-dependent oxidoreductase
MALTEIGGLEHLRLMELPEPRPGPDDVLLRVATVAANRQDLNTILGRFPNPDLRFPHVLGLDPAGVVIEVGDRVTDLAPGQRVVVKPPIGCLACPACLAGEDDACDRLRSVGVHRPGGQAELVAVPASNAFPIPDGIPFAQATALAHSFPVALTLLRRAGLTSEDRLFVTGAGGAIGAAVVQLARRAGARVIAGVGNAPAEAWLRSLSSDLAPEAVIDYRAGPAFADDLRERLSPGVSLHVETTADPLVWTESLRALARRARAAVVGAHAGPVVEVDLNWLFRQRVSIVGCSGSTRAAFSDVLALAGARAIRPRIDSELPLEDAAMAYRRLMGRQNGGKVVLRVTTLAD